MKFVLIVFFAVDYGGLGNPDNGKSGPAAVSIPGYISLPACNAAKRELKDQIVNPDLKSRTFAFCIPGP
jgi:hypothetical protein